LLAAGITLLAVCDGKLTLKSPRDGVFKGFNVDFKVSFLITPFPNKPVFFIPLRALLTVLNISEVLDLFESFTLAFGAGISSGEKACVVTDL